MIEGLSADELAGFLAEFLPEARERVTHLEQLLLAFEAAGSAERATILVDAKRELHTLKGNAGMLGLADVRHLAHELEDLVLGADASSGAGPGAGLDVSILLTGVDDLRTLLDQLEGGPRAERGHDAAEPAGHAGAAEPGAGVSAGSVRIPFPVLDALVDRLSDLVITRNRLAEALVPQQAPDARETRDAVASRGDGAASEVREVRDVRDVRDVREVRDVRRREAARADALRLAFESFSKGFDALQDDVLRLRMVPLTSLFAQLKRVVHDEAARTGKDVRLDASGGDTPLDKALLECAQEALGHLVRNAVVHGLEGAEHRAAAGKAATGTVRLTAGVRGSEVVIDVVDDGGGIDPEALARTAAQRGIDVAAHPDVYAVLFLPGFSTKEDADISAGRGIGLSAVLDSVQRHGGRVEVTSVVGRGTRFRLRLPLSVSILRALVVRVDGEEYAIPLSAIVESTRMRPGDVHEVNHAGVVRWRGDTLSALDLGCAFGTARALRQRGFLVLVEADGKRRALLADVLLGIRSIVVKALDSVVGAPLGVAGSTILGDGRVIMILDPASLVAMSPFLPQVA